MRAPFCAAAIVLIASGVEPARAQHPTGSPITASALPTGDTPLIEWSGDRKLATSDFKGKIPARGDESSLSWVAIEAAWDCQDGKAIAHGRAVFDPNRSWWRDVVPNLWRTDDRPSLFPRDNGGRALLAHEQLHFDMTEIWARRIREAFKALPEACLTPSGPRRFEKIMADLDRRWQEEQRRYDKETDHGLNVSRQRAWAQKIENTLRRDTYVAAAP